MQSFGDRLRERAQALGLSDAEVARRARLGERRYGHYVTGDREPDLATLIRICHTLQTTPDWLLGFAAPEGTERAALLTDLAAVAHALSDTGLRIAIRQTAALREFHPAVKEEE